MATTKPISREAARQLLPAIDLALKRTLADMGLVAFRFDADVCAEEGWMRVKVKVRSVDRV